MALRPGDHLGRYEIIAPAGERAGVETYKARDTHNGDVVAIRRAPPAETAQGNIEILKQLRHPHICALLAAGPGLHGDADSGAKFGPEAGQGSSMGADYLVFEWVEGDRVTTPAPAEKAVEYAAQILDALAAGHALGIAHGDLSIDKIVVTSTGVKLLDFGLKAGDATDGPSADVRAFGGVLYSMLTGTPVSAKRRSIQPRALEALLSRCLDAGAERGPSAAEAREELRKASVKRSFVREYWFGLAAVLMLFAGLAIFFVEMAPGKPLSPGDEVVIGDFTNHTGEAVFNQTLRTALVEQIEQSPYIALVEERKIRRDLTRMGRPPEEPLTRAAANQVCAMEHAKALMTGNLADLGNAYALTVEVTDCRTGARLAREQAEAMNKEQVLKAISTIAANLRVTLGEPLTSVRKLDLPAERALTPSLDALHSYALGMLQRSAGADRAAIAFIEQATEADPKFAAAHFQLSNIYSALGDARLSAQHLTRAYELRDQLGERDRLRVIAAYERTVTRDAAKSADAERELTRLYPRETGGTPPVAHD
jgi:hypothetical protein